MLVPLLATAPLFALGIWFGVRSLVANQQQDEREARDFARAAITVIDRALLYREHAASLLAAVRASDVHRRNELRTLMRSYEAQYDALVVLVGPDGRATADAPASADTAAPDLSSGRGYGAVSIAAAAGQPAVSDAFANPRTGRPLVAVAVPVEREGHVAEVVVALIENAYFEHLLRTTMPPAMWAVSLHDRSGSLIASTAADPVQAAKTPYRFAAQSQVSGWTVGVDVPADLIESPLRTAAVFTAASLALALAGGILGSALVARRIARAVDSLTDNNEKPRAGPRLREIERVRDQLADSALERTRALGLALAAGEMLRETLDRVSEGFIALDSEGRVTYANHLGRELLGSAEEPTPPDCAAWDALARSLGQPWCEAARRAMTSGERQRLEFHDPRHGRWIEAKFFPGAGGMSSWLADVTARRDADNALRASERRWHELFEANSHPMWTFDLDTLRFVEVNEAAVRHYGYSREEFLALTVADIRPIDQVKHLRAALSHAGTESERVIGRDGILRNRYEGSRPFEGVFRHRTKDGRLIDVDVTLTALRTDGRRTGLASVFDITARLAAERERLAALRAQAATDRLLAEVMARVTEGYVAFDRSGVCTYANGRAAELLGLPAPEALTLRSFAEVLPVAADDALMAALTQALSAPEPMADEYTFAAHARWLGAHLYPSADGVTLLISDVTASRVAHLALQASEKRYRTLFESNPSPMWVRDNETLRVLEVNEAAVHVYGWSRDEMLGATVEMLHMPVELERLRALVDAVRADPGLVVHPAGHWIHRHKDGSPLDVEIVSAPIEYEGRVARLTVATVITERLRAQAALRDAEAYQRSLFEAIGDGVLLLGNRLQVLDANPAAQDMLGYGAVALRSVSLRELVPARDHARIDETVTPLLGADGNHAGVRRGEWDHQRSDGSTFAAEISARAVAAGRVVTVLRDISQRRAVQRALMTYQMELSELTQRLLAQERETTRLVAQTLHDHLGQSLAAARLRLDAALARAGNAADERLRDEFARLGSALDQALADVRLVLGELRPPMLEEQGLIAALDNEIQVRARDAAGVDVLLEVDDVLLAGRWPADVEYAAFMVAREAIVNAQRHAGASLVRVIVDGDDGCLMLDIVDDGRGIPDAARAGRPGHLGIVGMRERAIAIGARFAVEQLPAEGTRVVLHWQRERSGHDGSGSL